MSYYSKILLAKRADGLLEAGKWCLVGGYAERGETTKETAVRETLEESGWSIQNLRLMYINDNPNRPGEDRQNVDFIYLADATQKVGEKDWESTELRWFALDALPPAKDIAFDHVTSLRLYIKYCAQPFALPTTDITTLSRIHDSKSSDGKPPEYQQK